MLALADSFAEEAQLAWNDHFKANRVHSTHIIEALSQALLEAGHPYQEQCSDAWLKQVLGQYISTFNPNEMTSPGDE